MLVLNCTQAACDFFTRKVKGSTVTPVQPAPSKKWQDDAFNDADGRPLPQDQWQVHCVTRKRKPVLMVMHMPTRYAMVFTDIKRADLAGFLQQFVERLLNQMMTLGIMLGLLREDEHAGVIERFMQSHDQFQIFARSDRSVQSHINQALFHFDLMLEDIGVLPANTQEAAGFDAQVNRTIRKIGPKEIGYFCPDEAMLAYWWERVGHLDRASSQEAQLRFKLLKNERPEGQP
ncbi:hypothetical protein ASF84_23440 [Pseudomonas sp. Leaf127]|uniref:DUF6933 domain-containing protein n=1 Tax=Pseudomonas sp. Leaf127 TaxID=1736267 RepID=UPI0007023E80|nr:hypothetical protein [Pseudomonas sp. Leaf127]KQQ49258.1 hypothetical protein ASF84_23440 [Pseudomonas sp. Leaf127]